MNNRFLASSEELRARLDEGTVRIVETPWKTDGYNRAHIPGAACRPGHSYLKEETAEGERSAHAMGPAAFNDFVSALGLRPSDEIVVYDDYHGLFAARLWWTLNRFGFENVRVLDGGWQEWVKQGGPVATVPHVPTAAPPQGLTIQRRSLIGVDELQEWVEAGSARIWDARRPGEFSGEEASKNARLGHIPGAVNVDWREMLREAEVEGAPRRFKSPEEMKAILERAGLAGGQTVVTLCQAGVRGAFASFVLEMLGYPRHRLYDASMAEWANRDDTPMTRGT